MKNRIVGKRRINFQKVFNLVSFTFILACFLFYGIRFVKLYLENNKVEELNTISKNIIQNNEKKDNFKNINGTYYFNGNDTNNYVLYSNLIWRVIRINTDKTITLILNNSITALARGEKKSYNDSYHNIWLNKQDEKYTGIFEESLNLVDNHLTYTNTCNDTIDSTKNITCKNTTSNILITIPSINDYVNTGSSDSFMNNEEYFYLINTNSKDKVWYVDSEGKVNTSDGTDIMGVKPVITINNTISYKSGDGSKDNPYTFEEKSGIFGSYVKLDNDIWRVYEVSNDNVKLSLNSYLKINSKEVKYKYSSEGYYHNDTKSDTLAYYLKNTFLKSRNYKNIVDEVNFSNGIYSSTNNYDYKKTLNTVVPTKVATLSIGDIFLNANDSNYYTSTGVDKKSNLVYVMQNDFKMNTKVATSELKIIPIISIKKELLTKGNGTLESPYEVE